MVLQLLQTMSLIGWSYVIYTLNTLCFVGMHLRPFKDHTHNNTHITRNNVGLIKEEAVLLSLILILFTAYRCYSLEDCRRYFQYL